MTEEAPIELELLNRLSKDLRQSAKTLADREVRFLVDAYYMMQDDRKRADNQVRALGTNEEPHAVINWLSTQSRTLERQIAVALDIYSRSKQIGQWARSVDGIGPIIAAGLMAHIDIKRAPTVGHIWRYAGLDPTSRWLAGQKRPWNAELKKLCWKIGESFVKVSNKPTAFYGEIYKNRKAYEIARNGRGEMAETAKAILAAKKIGKDTDAYAAYSKGRLPPAHIHSRAKRYAVKIFLSHWHDQAYRIQFGKAPPLPFAIAILQHAHYIEPPEGASQT